MYPSVEEILSQTDRGLDVILDYYPDTWNYGSKKGKHFKMNDRENEKTASANIFYSEKSNRYYVKDHGNSWKAKDCFGLVQHEENCDFHDAIIIICERMRITVDGKTVEPKPEFETRKAEPNEHVGDWIADERSFEVADMKHLFAAKVIKSYENRWKNNHKNEEYDAEKAMKPLVDILKKYGFKALKSRSKVREDGTVLIVKATDIYPMYIRKEGDFIKILNPKAKDKKDRFFYHGSLPDGHVNGYAQLVKAYNELVAPPDDIDADEDDKKESEKLKGAILCSGERDAINVAAACPDYYPIWLGSETNFLPKKKYTSIRQKVEDVFNLPDIDATGLREALRLALNNLDIRTIYLPKSMLKQRDHFRKKPKKDVRDYLGIYWPKDLYVLIESAMPLKFWDYRLVKPQGGGSSYYKYDINNIYLYNFLNKTGFFRYKTPRTKEGFVFCYQNDNIVKTVQSSEIADMILRFVQEREPSNFRLQNAIVRSSQLSESSLSKIAYREPDFSDYTKDAQYFFFENQTWEVTKKGIQSHKPGYITRAVWEEDLIKHQVKVTEPPFVISKDVSGNWQVEVKDKDSDWLNFLIQTCRMYWYEELEVEMKKIPKNQREKYLEENKYTLTGANLGEDAQQEQIDHFVNRVYMLGYVLHRYKDPSRPWTPWIMENSNEQEGTSQGGSGKSIIMSSVKYMCNYEEEGMRNRDKMKQAHFLENVSEKTDCVGFDDCDQYMPFFFFYPYITGNFQVNAKFVSAYNIAFDDSPKLIFCSNFPPNDDDPSTKRRLIFSVTSDYYHTENEHSPRHKQVRKPIHDFGRNLFKDWDAEQWNKYFNVMANCLVFYLNQEDMVKPPMNKVAKRSLVNFIGESFLDWANEYFDIFNDESINCNKLLVKHKVFEDCINHTKSKMKPNTFTKKLKAYAELHRDQITLNPKELQNSQGRISRNKDGDGNVLEATKDMLYIRIGDAKLNDSSLKDSDNTNLSLDQEEGESWE